MHRAALICLVILAASITAPAFAQTPEAVPPPDPATLRAQDAAHEAEVDQWTARKILHRSIALALYLGVAGSADLPAAPHSPLSASYGLVFRYEHPASRFVVLGGQVSLHNWSTTAWSALAAAGRSNVFDVSLVLKLRYPIRDRAEFYLAAPGGIVFSSGDDSAFGGRTRLGIGYSVAGLVGARFAMSPSTGFFTEFGLVYRVFQHVVLPTGSRYHIDVQMLQPVILLGLYARA